MQLKAEYHIDYKLHTSASVLPELESKGVYYENLPQKYRYGLIYSRVKNISPFEFDTNIGLLRQLCFSNQA